MEPIKAVAEIPTSVYVVIGIMVLTNLSTLLALVKILFNAGMFVQETRMGIHDARATAVRAHKRIDKVTGDSEGE